MIETGDLRRGMTIEIDGELYQVLDVEHLKLGRGTAQVRMRLRNLRAGHIIDRTVQAGTRFVRAYLEARTAQFLYKEGDIYHFLDQETYEEYTLGPDVLGDAVNYLKEGMQVELLFHRDQPVAIELPTAVDLKVIETPPAFRGDTAAGGTKPATLETGLVIQVPFFIDVGDVVRVDTRTGEYIERATAEG